MAIDFQLQNGFIGPFQKGGQSYLRSSDFGEQVTVPGGSDYYELCRQGFVFSANVVTAAAIPIFSTLTNSPTLWNQAGSGKVVIPLFLNCNVAAIGTPVLTSLTVSYLKNAGAQIGTGAPIITFTNIVPTPMKIGGSACSTQFSGATVTFTTQPAILFNTGLTHWLEGTAASGNLVNFQYDFKGSVIMPPGTSISIGAIVATSTTFNTSIVFAEFPNYLY